MNRSGKLHALLSTARVANIPSVVSNVWVGVALGIAMNANSSGQSLVVPWMQVACLSLAGILLYVGGNFFNDWMDRKWDAVHRPERALPRGLFSPGAYLGLTLLLTGMGTGLAWAVDLRSGLVAAGIVLMITIYTIWHKKNAWMVVPMGLCRAGLPVMGYLAIYPYLDAIWPLAAALFCYIMGLSLSARHESKAESPKSVARVARGLFLVTAVMVAVGSRFFYLDPLPRFLGALPYLAWTGFCLKYWHQPVPKLVSGLLAGIPWVDWMTLLPLGVTFANDTREGAGLFAAVSLIIPPLAFIFALLLQRLAPAT
jgi:4-hydroxybenzoate polyprenyltransferase